MKDSVQIFSCLVKFLALFKINLNLDIFVHVVCLLMIFHTL